MNQSPYELLLSLKHEGTVEEYREMLELYGGPLRGTKPEYLKGIFLNELKEVVRAELKLHPVNSLPELMDYAQRIDEKNSLMEKGNAGGNRGGLTRSYSSSRIVTWDPGNKVTMAKTRETSSSSKSNSVKSIGAYRGRPFRRLSNAEFQERTGKGLCYRCDGKFSLVIHAPINNSKSLFWEKDKMKKTKKKRRQDMRNSCRVFSCPCTACQD